LGLVLNRLAERIRGSGPPAWELMIDGKPLPVGRCSKDPDAKGGLGPLPNRVRRLGRVERWVWCKLMINAARILVRRREKGQMQ
jgi:hypothetical protein